MGWPIFSSKVSFINFHRTDIRFLRFKGSYGLTQIVLSMFLSIFHEMFILVFYFMNQCWYDLTHSAFLEWFDKFLTKAHMVWSTCCLKVQIKMQYNLNHIVPWKDFWSTLKYPCQLKVTDNTGWPLLSI